VGSRVLSLKFVFAIGMLEAVCEKDCLSNLLDVCFSGFLVMYLVALEIKEADIFLYSVDRVFPAVLFFHVCVFLVDSFQ
jgi:hypothetical protein